MQTINIQSWSHLQEELFTGSWNDQLGRFRTQNAFRGLSDSTYELKTTLQRLGGPFPELERHLLRNFRKYAQRNVVERDSIWYWMALAQHHGLPSRFLDWTHSPLIAMHFATANLARFDRDGAIWMVNYAQTHQLLPDALRKPLEAEGANVFTLEMLSQTVATLNDFDRISMEPCVLFIEPPSIDDRIVNQYSLFSAMSSPTAVHSDWLARYPHLVRKLIIPARLKWEIRDKLDSSNINERVLFPGLDGLSSWLKRHYSPISGGELMD